MSINDDCIRFSHSVLVVLSMEFQLLLVERNSLCWSRSDRLFCKAVKLHEETSVLHKS